MAVSVKKNNSSALDSAISARAAQLAQDAYDAYHQALLNAVRSGKCKPGDIETWQPGIYLVPAGANGERLLQWTDGTGTPRRRVLKPSEVVIDGRELVKLDHAMRTFQSQFDTGWLQALNRNPARAKS